jgi:hypothetical protein
MDEKDIDLSVVLFLEEALQGDRRILGCGCQAKITCSFPNAPWFSIASFYIVCDWHMALDTTLGWSSSARLGWVDTDGTEISKLRFALAVHNCFKLKLPSALVHDAGSDFRGLVSKEGLHVIRSDGRIYRRPGTGSEHSTE